MLSHDLDPVEIRIVGALIEKELATPDNYPLSLNALTNACNQSTNREPVMSLDEEAVSRAVESLRRRNLVRSIQASGSRVPKFRHLLSESDGLSRAELAVLSVLMLRGPQTAAEARSRAARLMTGDLPDGLDAALEALIAREPLPLAARLPRRPGQKEARFATLVGGEITAEHDDEPASPTQPASPDRITSLEQATRDLRADVADLRAQFAEFRKQFE